MDQPVVFAPVLDQDEHLITLAPPIDPGSDDDEEEEEEEVIYM